MSDEVISNFIQDIVDDDLASGRVDHVHTRFPPEPNGYLHIGSAKAIWINYSTAKKYGGKFNLRYDDTNPSKEDDEYVRAIEEDLRWLGAIPDAIYYGSDYFDACYEYALKLIDKGLAYVCDLSADEMREYRGTLTEAGRESPYRNRSIAENRDLFIRMKNGEFPDGSRTLRAKIDMSSPNITLRDPAIYRILRAHHHRQGDKWCIYPLYDYAHPIQDATEKITHSLCSLEFLNNRPMYNWVIESLELSPAPHQYEFARLNMTYTVMSKRYLRQLVESGLVDGWDDPRMPTICGLRRRGYTPASIFEFVKRAGVSKVYSIVDIKLFEACIREELNKSAYRKMAVTKPLKVTIENYPEGQTEYFDISNNPGDENSSTRAVPFTRNLFIEQEDFEEVPPPKYNRLKPGGDVRLIGSYVIAVKEIIKDANGDITELIATYDPETRTKNPTDGHKVKGTIHWVSADYAYDCEICMYDNLFTLEDVNGIPEGKTYNDYLNVNSIRVLKHCKAEPSLADAAAGERFQFVRMGYFCKDTKNANTFNRTVSLKDGYGKDK